MDNNQFADNYYARLGVSKNATPHEIRQAYLDIARKFHPDVKQTDGVTNLFLGIQEAYEVLSNPSKRVNYDLTLPPIDVSPGVVIDTIYSRSTLLTFNEPQLLYVLLDVMADSEKSEDTSAPLNICLVIDQSTSMAGQRMDTVKAAAKNILRQLRPEDYLSIVTFADRAEVIVPASRHVDHGVVDAMISRIQTGGGTEIFNGLELGFQEVSRNNRLSQINHIILITDGHTYGDEYKCLHLAEKGKTSGITITGLGIGDDWNDEFIDQLTSITGGSSEYITNPKQINRILQKKLSGLSQTYAEGVRINADLGSGVDLQYAFRMQPDPGPIAIRDTLNLGNLNRNENLQVIFEFLIQNDQNLVDLQLMEGTLLMEIPARIIPTTRSHIEFSRPINDQFNSVAPPVSVREALAKLTMYRMQAKARSEIQNGNVNEGTIRLQNLATNLLARGEGELAATVLKEARSLEKDGVMREGAEKRIKYGTRSLL